MISKAYRKINLTVGSFALFLLFSNQSIAAVCGPVIQNDFIASIELTKYSKKNRASAVANELARSCGSNSADIGGGGNMTTNWDESTETMYTVCHGRTGDLGIKISFFTDRGQDFIAWSRYQYHECDQGLNAGEEIGLLKKFGYKQTN